MGIRSRPFSDLIFLLAEILGMKNAFSAVDEDFDIELEVDAWFGDDGRF